MKLSIPTSLVALALVVSSTIALAQGTAFTYQGQLSNGSNVANGTYDLKFSIYDAVTNGSQKGNSLTNSATGVAGGLFTVTLDFGAGIFDGTARWLETAVRTNGGSAFTTLSPRQQITPAPYAIDAGNLSGTVSASQLSGAVPLANLPTTALVTNGQAGVNLTGSFSGNGGSLSNLQVYSLAGTTTNSVIIAWGNNAENEINIPIGLMNVTAVAAGGRHSLAVKGDQTVVAWGNNASGQTNVPPGLSNVVGVAAGGSHSLAMKSDGTVVAWGDNTYNQTNVPAGLHNAIAVAAGSEHSMALRSDGTVIAWGFNGQGETNIPAAATNVIAVAAGSLYCVALKGSGTVVAWGDSNFGETSVPVGLSNVVAIAAGSYHGLALKNDGTVAAWGYNNHGQANVPAGLSNVVAVAAGAYHSLALRADGTVVAWGDNTYGQTIIPAASTNTIALAPGSAANHVLTIQPQIFTPASLLNQNNIFAGYNVFNGSTVFAGPVGIGTTHPQQLLHLNVPLGAGEGMEIDSATPGHAPAIYLNHIGTGGLDYRIASYGDNSTPGHFAIRDETAGVERLTINSAGVISGNGNGLASLNAPSLTGAVPSTSLTSVPAGNLTGSIADTLLSANVPLLNRNGQTFTGANTIASPGNLSFGSQTRQMLNLWSTVYGIGIQSLTMYFRVDSNGGGGGYDWYKGGSHSDAQNDPGPGGTTLMRLDTFGNLNISGGFGSLSDRNAKEQFQAVDSRAVLEKVNALPLSRWSYKTDPASRHLGPMAQDFRAAFEVGWDDKSICLGDEGGVALAAIQGLNQKLEDTNRRLESENAELRSRLEKLEQLMNSKTFEDKQR